MNDQLVQELREYADTLVKMANDETLLSKVASAENTVSSERADYMDGVMQGLGLE